MEERALVHLPMLPVSVPVGTKDPTARTEVHTTKNMLACMLQLVHGAYVHCISYLQLVFLPAGMEEHALVHLPMLPVSVPVGTQGSTARTEVGTRKNMLACMQQLVHGAYVHCVFHICSL